MLAVAERMKGLAGWHMLCEHPRAWAGCCLQPSPSPSIPAELSSCPQHCSVGFPPPPHFLLFLAESTKSSSLHWEGMGSGLILDGKLCQVGLRCHRGPLAPFHDVPRCCTLDRSFCNSTPSSAKRVKSSLSPYITTATNHFLAGPLMLMNNSSDSL